jgi:hypothetical protein
VVAAGGDGTVNEVANGLLGSDLPLAVMPTGTINVLARELGLGRSVQQVAHAILEGRVGLVWPGLANGRAFLLMAGIGFDAAVVAAVSPPLKRPRRSSPQDAAFMRAPLSVRLRRGSTSPISTWCCSSAMDVWPRWATRLPLRPGNCIDGLASATSGRRRRKSRGRSPSRSTAILCRQRRSGCRSPRHHSGWYAPVPDGDMKTVRHQSRQPSGHSRQGRILPACAAMT